MNFTQCENFLLFLTKGSYHGLWDCTPKNHPRTLRHILLYNSKIQSHTCTFFSCTCTWLRLQLEINHCNSAACLFSFLALALGFAVVSFWFHLRLEADFLPRGSQCYWKILQAKGPAHHFQIFKLYYFGTGSHTMHSYSHGLLHHLGESSLEPMWWFASEWASSSPEKMSLAGHIAESGLWGSPLLSSCTKSESLSRCKSILGPTESYQKVNFHRKSSAPPSPTCTSH